MNLNSVQLENLKNEKLLLKIVCFLSMLESECKACYMHHCNDCNNKYAQTLLEEINFDKKIISEGEGTRKYQKIERTNSIVKALGNKWKTAKEIKIKDLSERGVRNALLTALKDGVITRKTSPLGYIYHVAEENKNE